MKIRVLNELLFTVFFGRENASENMKSIFNEVYGDFNRMFTEIEPTVVYKNKMHTNNIKWN